METAKFQLRLRSLDAGGRSAGTGRPPLVPPGSPAFARSLTQGLERVQAEERATRQANDEAIQGRSERRKASAARDQQSTRATASERRAEAEEHGAERAAQARASEQTRARRHDAQRAGDQARAEERRAAQADRGRGAGRGQEHTPGVRPDPPPAPREAPTAATPAPPQPATSAAAGAQARPAGSATPAQVPAGLPGALSSMPAPQAGTSVPALAPAAVAVRAAGPASPAGPQPTAGASTATEHARPQAAPRRPAPAPAAPDLERAEAILRQVRIALQPGLRSATLQLHPAELGRVVVRLRVREERVQVALRAESEAALAVLERHLPELRAMFAQQGFVGAELDLGLAGGGDLGGAPAGDHEQRGPSRDPQETPLDPIALARPLAAAEGGVDLLA